MQLPDPFFQIAADVYRHDEFWLGEDPQAVAAVFADDSHYCRAGGRVWAECLEGSRLAGFFDPQLRIDGQPVAYFGYWETDNNRLANAELFHRFESWAAAQGAVTVYGPINGNLYGMNRIRLSAQGDGAQTAPFIGEPYNPGYYPQLLSGLGYQIRYRYYTQINNDPDALITLLAPIVQQGKAALNGQFRFQPLTGDIWRERLPELYPLTDQMFRGSFGYSSISEQQFIATCGDGFARRLCPHSSVLVTGKHDDIAAYFLVFPDYSPLIRAGQVSADSVNFSDHFDRLTNPRMGVAKTAAVHPDYRRAGLYTLMSMQLSVWGGPYYQRGAAALVREDNPSLSFGRRFISDDQQRVYALYQKNLGTGQDC